MDFIVIKVRRYIDSAAAMGEPKGVWTAPERSMFAISTFVISKALEAFWCTFLAGAEGVLAVADLSVHAGCDGVVAVV